MNDVSLTAVLDPTPGAARQRLRDRGLDDEPRFFTELASFAEAADDYDGIILGTRCNLHSPLAVELAEAGVDVPLLLEKPVAIDTDQLVALAQAYRGREQRVVVSFPLRMTPLFEKVLEVVQSGRLGPINQVQAYNHVSYGGVYFGKWYRDFSLTGGLWLQKATHDFDYINALIGHAPLAVAAMHTRTVYGGNQPDDLRCSQCDLTDTCIESPEHIARRGNDGGMGYDDHMCAFSAAIRNQDAGSALLMYANGVHAAYSQNFLTRRSAGQRGARITGHHGTVTFDWANDRLWIHDHHTESAGQDHHPAPIEIAVEANDGHAGGDARLIENYLEVIRGEAPSHTPLQDGVLSAAMCLAARTSANTATFQPITTPDQVGHAPADIMPTGVEMWLEGTLTH